VATAWLEYHEALEHARRDQQSDRVAIAEARLAALSPLLSYLTLEVPATARVPELHIQLDGRPIALAAWGTPLLIDPGTHRVEVRAPGHHSLAVDFETKGNSQRQSMQIPTLALVAPSPATPKTSNAPPADTARQRVRGAGIALIVVGATSALAGAYFGLRANAAWNERNEHCRGGRCDAFAVTRWRDAQRFAAFSTGACVLSALAGGTGAYLTISSARRSAPNSPGGTSFALGWTGQL